MEHTRPDWWPQNPYAKYVDRWSSITAARYWIWQKCDEAIWNAIVRNASKSDETQ